MQRGLIMTTTIAGIKINNEYRAALEFDKIGGYYCRLYHTTTKKHPQLNVPIIITEAENHYGWIDEKTARRRYYSQQRRWIK